MDAHCEMILQEYRDSAATFEKMRDIVLGLLKEVFEKNDLLIAALEARVKTEKSLAGKLDLKGSKYASISDITDILGARVVTFYADEVDRVAALVEQNFDIDRENSIDKRKVLDTDRFGYLSLHYICRIPERTYKDPEHPELNELRFEVQMRSLLQHVWANAEHDAGYKSDVEIPREYKREFARLAGLLELADEQITKVLRDIEDYRHKVRALVKGGNFSELRLDGDTFRGYMDIGPFDKLNDKIAGINHAEIQESNPMPYLKVFSSFGFETLGDVEKMKLEYSDAAYQLAVKQFGTTDLDILSSNVGLQDLCLAYILKTDGSETGIRKFFDTIYGERPLNARSAKRVIEQAKSAGII